MNLKAYKPISDLKRQVCSLWYSFANYELLKPDSLRKGHIVENTGIVPVVVWYGIELIALNPPYPVVCEVILQPGEWYLGDVPEIIPLAARWFKESDKFGLATLAVTEFV